MAVASTLASCNVNNDKDRQSLEDISKQELATALNERDELLSLVKEVSAGLNEIKHLENIMTIAASKSAENPEQRTQILRDIADIKARISQRRQHLNDLEDKLQESTINNKDLTETIGALRAQMDQQMEEIESLRKQLLAATEHIGTLNSAVDSLNSTINTVTGERNEARETTVKLENELNTCYYVVASKSELKKHKIIESGFLRKTRLMKGDFDKGLFIAGDKRTLDSLPLDASKVKVLTNHPARSYEILDINGRKTIRITNPAEFWSLSNYLVIQKD